MLESSGLQNVAWSLGLACTAGKLRRHFTFLKGTDKKKKKSTDRAYVACKVKIPSCLIQSVQTTASERIDKAVGADSA